MKKANPFKGKAILALQSNAAHAESIQYWMAEASQEGINAEKMLTEAD
ncbi:hypothetical protein [Noviherbaspirillum malthae]|nr:hypothetical protein [Noviherbaspirillum malthae]